ncbi:MAG TPA: plasmid pRiA4b ORF-3 family protein [Nitrolancea sp.]|nr:plasmid pRiA4b ORF-3 family protein [Nitrolancea sp.]
MPGRADTSQVFQLKVTLRGSKPPIWRRLQLRGSTTLPELHEILQIVMDWDDAHLHSFTAGGVEYGVPEPGGFDAMRSEKRARLDRLVRNPKDRIRYEYDFGDSWDHDLVVEKVLPADPTVRYPVVLAGRRAAPPEDVGGIWGYAHFLQSLNDPADPEHEMYTEWIGGDFDPEAFDLDELNRALQRV